MAVGAGSIATQTISGSIDAHELGAALTQLRSKVASCDLPADAQQELQEGADKLIAATKKPPPDRSIIEAIFKAMVSKVKFAARLTKDAAHFIEPISKIAKIIGIGLAVLGL